MAKKKTEETAATAEVVVEAPTDEQLEELSADIADAAAKVAKAKAMVALAEPRVEHLASVAGRIREATTPEKQIARYEEAQAMLKDLFKEPKG